MAKIDYDKLAYEYDDEVIALAKYFGIHPNYIDFYDNNNTNCTITKGKHAGESYLVVNDSDGDDIFEERILNLMDEIGLDEFFSATNLNIENYIDYESIVQDLESMYGRGHELATYDNDEIELDNGYYAYRTE